MAHPNPLYEMTSGACWRLQQIYLELKGEGYFVYEFDALGRPVELWPLPTHWVQQTPYVGYPYYEIRTTGGLIRQIPVDDIFCMKELNPLDPYKRGLGAAESLADEIETDEYAAKFQKKFFYNDATPTTLISMPGSSKDQRDRFRSEWNERFRGPFNSHGIATVDGNVTVTKLAENMRDMDMTEGRRFLRDACLSILVFRVKSWASRRAATEPRAKRLSTSTPRTSSCHGSTAGKKPSIHRFCRSMAMILYGILMMWSRARRSSTRPKALTAGMPGF